jgi:ABC-type dipeptide/oligopeptide/nickel transport system permease component
VPLQIAMIAYIARRLMFLPIILFGVTVLLFAMLQLLNPYERLSLYVKDPSQLRGGKEQLDRLIEKHGLKDPLLIQYGRWVHKLFQGDFGWSETAKTTVLNGFLGRFPATLELTLFAIGPILLLAIWLGVLAAVHHNRWIDQLTRVVTILGYSLPSFVLGLVLLMGFYGLISRNLPPLFEGWFSPGRLSSWAQQIVNTQSFHSFTGLITIDAILNGQWRVFWDALGHLILPVATLSYINWAGLLRIMRSSMLETLRQDYITTARAKGLPEHVVTKRHARRNALIPIITLSGFLVVGLLSGVVITETIFSYPGLGSWAAQAALQLDVATVLGLLTFVTALFIVVNLIVDLLYAIVDPRVRLT